MMDNLVEEIEAFTLKSRLVFHQVLNTQRPLIAPAFFVKMNARFCRVAREMKRVAIVVITDLWNGTEV